MANIKIIDLPTGSPESDSFLEATQVNDQAESGRSSAKVAFNALGNWMAGQGQSPLQYNGLNTDSDTLIGAINELLVYVLNIADEYDPTATYDVDDYCIYQGVLYKCTTAIAVAEAWNSAHWTSTLIVDEFGTGGGASVTLGTTVPSDASGDNGDLYVQYDGSTYAVVEYFVKVNDSWRKAPYSRVVALTQAQYDLITPDPTTLYIITDAQSSYQTKSDNSLDTDDKTIVGAINEVNTALSGLNSDSYFKNDSDTINPSVSKNVLEKALTKGIYAVSFTITFQTTEGDKSLFTVIREHASPNTALLSQSIKSLSGDFSSMVCSGIIELATDMTIDFRVGNKLSNNTPVNYRISIIKLI